MKKKEDNKGVLQRGLHEEWILFLTTLVGCRRVRCSWLISAGTPEAAETNDLAA